MCLKSMYVFIYLSICKIEFIFILFNFQKCYSTTNLLKVQLNEATLVGIQLFEYP